MVSPAKLNAAFKAFGKGRDEDVETIGIAAVMEQLARFGGPVLGMQAALQAGLARSQRREARRLTAGDESDPEAAAAAARAEKLERLHGTLAGAGAGVASLVEGLAAGGVFHGFVFTADGEPAGGHGIEARGLARKALKARTDETGYFRIAYADAGTAASREPGVAAYAAEPSKEDEGAETATVVVTDPSGRIVFTDPTPPGGDEAGNIFRYYPLPHRARRTSSNTNA